MSNVTQHCLTSTAIKRISVKFVSAWCANKWPGWKQLLSRCRWWHCGIEFAKPVFYWRKLVHGLQRVEHGSSKKR